MEAAKPPTPNPNPYPLAGPIAKSAGAGYRVFDNTPRSKPRYRLHIYTSRNNTIATFTHGNGDVIGWCSGGGCGFKKSQRSGYEAGYQVAVKIFQRMRQELDAQGPAEIELCFKGFGQGRDAVQKAMLTSEGEFLKKLVVSVSDRTPLKIGGTRSKKARRL